MIGQHLKAMVQSKTQAIRQDGATEMGVTEQLTVEVGDAYALAYDDNSFDLVVAVGVTTWLEKPELAIEEFACVARPGGHVILTHGNQNSLHLLLDPVMNPLLRPIRKGVRKVLVRMGSFMEVGQGWRQ